MPHFSILARASESTPRIGRYHDGKGFELSKDLGIGTSIYIYSLVRILQCALHKQQKTGKNSTTPCECISNHPHTQNIPNQYKRKEIRKSQHRVFTKHDDFLLVKTPSSHRGAFSLFPLSAFPSPLLSNRYHQTHSHSPNTHHLALRSASTSPLHVPRSPTLIIVSQTPPPAASIALMAFSLFRISRRIFPLGA